MTADRFDRYKDALRRGHVAALRERFAEAIDAYEEAADLAPERALPHAAIGRILAKLDRPADALSAFGRALDRSPADEAALSGKGELLIALGQPVEAADAYARLAETQAAAGKIADATDAARRALELAESRPRRRFVERLVDQLRDAGGDSAAVEAMDRAMRVLEPPAEELPDVLDALAAEVPPEPEVAAPEEPAEPPQTPPERLLDEAESLAAAGRSGEARERYLAAASAYRGDRRLDAAVDACLTVLRFDPADPAVHLLLSELYLDHGWRSEANAKLDLLRRLSSLTGDDETERQAAAIAGTRLPAGSAPAGASDAATEPDSEPAAELAAPG
jgi:tetratricopeptide (TPR) repeat protein